MLMNGKACENNKSVLHGNRTRIGFWRLTRLRNYVRASAEQTNLVVIVDVWYNARSENKKNDGNNNNNSNYFNKHSHVSFIVIFNDVVPDSKRIGNVDEGGFFFFLNNFAPSFR